MLEKHIEKKVTDYAKEQGLLGYKFVSPARMAVPDRLFITKQGTVFFTEFKSTGKKPTPAQEREHLKLMGHNVRVFVIDDIENGKAVIDTMKGR